MGAHVGPEGRDEGRPGGLMGRSYTPAAGTPGPRTRGVSRRQVLAALAAAPAAVGLLGGCTVGAAEPVGPDPLVALADSARADAALVAAALAADPALAPRLDPLSAARTEHAIALDAEITRLAPTSTPSPSAAPTAAPTPATLAEVRTALRGSGEAAGAAALELPADRVGLVASIAACCTTYAAVLA
jgi:hypothetical protein